MIFEQSYLRIYWTDFYKFSLYDKHLFVTDLTLFIQSLKGRCHGN